MNLVGMALGLSTYIPGLFEKLTSGGGDTDSARYCYGVWLRHVASAQQMGIWNSPRSIAELGPGDSLGIGLAALISGAESYFAFDVVEHANNQRNLEIFDELVELFKRRADIPDEAELPVVKPYLDSYEFPHLALSQAHLDACLVADRIERLRRAVQELGNGNEQSPIRYVVPWMGFPKGSAKGSAMTSATTSANHEHGASALQRGSIDMIYSQAVLEHVDELAGAYDAMSEWLSPSGFMSHQIDFKSHGTAGTWNGHWSASALEWRLIRGRRPFLINRQPCSVHLDMLAAHGFQQVLEKRIRSESGIARSQLAREFGSMANDDLTTSGVYLLAVPDHRTDIETVTKSSRHVRIT